MFEEEEFDRDIFISFIAFSFSIIAKNISFIFSRKINLGYTTFNSNLFEEFIYYLNLKFLS